MGGSSSSPKSITLVPGVSATILGREWRCKFADGAGNAGGLINSKALEEAQQLLDQTLATVKAVGGVQRVGRVVCGGCKDFKVISALGVDEHGAWEKAEFAPEKEFLEKLGKIAGISAVETQTYTFEEVVINAVDVGDKITLVPGVDADTLGREWRCKFTPSDDPPASGALISSKSLEAAQKTLDETLDQLKALPGVSAITRTVCGGCQDFKITIAMPLKEYDAWEKKNFAPEEEFLEKLKMIEGLHTVETQKYTYMSV
jgi:cytochrome c5